jgi:hypothetical protein
MNKKVDKTSSLNSISTNAVSQSQGSTPANAQCDDPLQELMTAWQQHSNRIEQIAGQHDLSHIKLAPRLFVFSSRRRSALSSLATLLVCLTVIVGMVILRQHYISDTFDLYFFLFVVLTLVLTAAQNISHTFLLRRLHPPRIHFHKPVSPLRYSLPRAAVFASIVVMFLFLAVPVQNGRAMSHGSPSHRSAALTSVSFVLSHIQ